jgi:hypothetical protein
MISKESWDYILVCHFFNDVFFCYMNDFEKFGSPLMGS